MILAIETSCDETCAAVVEGAEVRSNIVVVAGRPARPVRRRRARDRVAAPPRAGRTGRARGAGRRRRVVRRPARGRRHGRAGADRRAAGRRVGRQGLRLRGRQAADPGRPPARPRRVAVHRARAARAAVPLPAGVAAATRCCSTCTTTCARRCSGAASTTPRARPSTRARACSASATPAARRSSAAAAGGDPAAVALPVAMAGREGLDLSFSGLKTALRTRLRDEQHDVADLAASYQAAIVASLVSRTVRALEQTGARRLGVVGGVAANTLLRTALAGGVRTSRDRAALRSAGVLRRQRGHDRRRRGAPRSRSRSPAYLAIDAHARADLVAQSV